MKIEVSEVVFSYAMVASIVWVICAALGPIMDKKNGPN